jgi:hypothetical protein
VKRPSIPFGGQCIDANRWLSIDCIASKLNAMPSYAYMFNGGAGSSMLSQAWRETSCAHDHDFMMPVLYKNLFRRSSESQSNAAQLFTSSATRVY